MTTLWGNPEDSNEWIAWDEDTQRLVYNINQFDRLLFPVEFFQQLGRETVNAEATTNS